MSRRSPKAYVRLTRPLVRDSRDEPFRHADWDEALTRVAQGLSRAHGASGMLSCARAPHETNHVAGKFARVVMGTNNVDSCNRTCHVPNVAGLSAAFGTGGGTSSYEEVEQAVDPRRASTAEWTEGRLGPDAGTDIPNTRVRSGGFPSPLRRGEYIELWQGESGRGPYDGPLDDRRHGGRHHSPGPGGTRAAREPPRPAAGSPAGPRPDRRSARGGPVRRDGELLDVREDVGRHNAVDKLVGRALQDGNLPLSRTILLVPGRASFEPAPKAVMAGIPVPAAVSAPSSPAVDLAAETGLTLVGFLHGASMNVYAGEHRIALRAAATQG